jgi:hypothetical protein
MTRFISVAVALFVAVLGGWLWGVAFRADAAFARRAIYEALDARGVGYAIRIPANTIWS